MKKYLLLVFLLLVSLFSVAQQNKYLAGAVPEVGGRVIFQKSIAVKQPINGDRFFSLMDKWAQDNYKSGGNLNSRILLSDPQSRTIACSGEKHLVFKKSALVLDQAKMIYQLLMEVGDGECNVTVRGIKYDYSDSKELQPAEQMITDKVALNKKGDKLNRYYDKFRIQTVDSINSIFRSIDVYLNGVSTAGAAVQQVASVVEQPVAVAPAPVVEKEESQPLQNTASTMSGFKKITADKIPVSMIGKEVLILSGNVKEPSAILAKWRGTSTLMERLQAITNVSASRYSLIENAKMYTICFFTEIYNDGLAKLDSPEKIENTEFTPVAMPSGSPAFSEAWMIIECKKSGEIPAEDANLKSCLGEIINVWIK
ncbi:MAG: DUF4468 domain-containing protein [Prevotella sp.]|jgi:hypothetical protein|nr:DUF4468 domain-containing protein [Prevotella sp.]